jgi:hypothetical protein
LTAREYQELKLYCQIEFLPHEAQCLALGVKPEDLKWQPAEMDDEAMIKAIEAN